MHHSDDIFENIFLTEIPFVNLTLSLKIIQKFSENEEINRRICFLASINYYFIYKIPV